MLHYGKAVIRIIFVNCIACTKYWSSPFASLTCCSTVRIHWTVHYTWAVTSLSNADGLHHILVKTLPVHFAVMKWFVHHIYYDMFLTLSSITSKICQLAFLQAIEGTQHTCSCTCRCMFTHLSDECNCAVMLWAVSNLWPAFAWFIHSTWKLPMPNDGTARGCIFVSLWMNQSILISSFCCLLYVVFIPYGRHCCLCDDFSNLHPRWSNLCASSMQYVTETPTGHWPVHVQPTSIDDRNTLRGQAIDDLQTIIATKNTMIEYACFFLLAWID